MVKVLSRDAIQRMTGRRSSTTSVVGGGDGSDSGVSMAWVEENYVSKNFFNQLFTIHGTRTYIDEDTQDEVTEEVVITPNTIADGEEYELSNVEVSIGLWTQQFLSALGLNPGGGGGGSSTLAGLDDVQLGTLVNGQALVYDSASGKWVNGTVIPDLTDYAKKSWVQEQGYLTSAALTGYATESWVNNKGYATQSWVQQQGYLTSAALDGYLPKSGGTMTGDLHLGSSAGASPYIYFGDGTYVYIGEDTDDHLTIKGAKGVNFIVGSGYNVTINSANIATQSWVQQQGYLTSSALTDYATQSWVRQQGYLTSSALTDYATQSWVRQQGYLTSSALTDYATQSWVRQQGYLTSHQSVDGTFWGQSWSNHGSVKGDMTNVGAILQTGNYTLMNYQSVGLMIEGGAATGNEYRATFGLHQAGKLAWLDNTLIMQLKANTSTHEYLVHINNGILQIGDARLVWDSANNALKVVKADGSAANFYATGGVSALGYSS